MKWFKVKRPSFIGNVLQPPGAVVCVDDKFSPADHLEPLPPPAPPAPPSAPQPTMGQRIDALQSSVNEIADLKSRIYHVEQESGRLRAETKSLLKALAD